MILTEDLVQKLKSLERLIGSNMANTARMNRLEELGRVDSEKAFTKKGKRNLKDEKKRIVRELNKKKDGGSLKPVDKEKNPGLAKLPTKVRNKMGYMKKGGRVKMKSGGIAKREMDRDWETGFKEPPSFFLLSSLTILFFSSLRFLLPFLVKAFSESTLPSSSSLFILLVLAILLPVYLSRFFSFRTKLTIRIISASF